MVVFVKDTVDATDWYGGASHFLDGGEATLSELSETPGRPGQDTVPRHRRLALLNRVIAKEILPRLAVARRAAEKSSGESRARGIETTAADTDRMIRLLLQGEASDATAFIESLLLRGATAETLYTGLLPDAARGLGRMWDEDRCDFAQVTIGLGHLQTVARALSPRFQAGSVTRADGFSLLLLPAPGEQHTFGLQILAEFFRRAGWIVTGGPISTGFDPAGMVRETWFDVAGFSIGSEDRAGSLAKTIHRVRRASRNHALGIMAGGPLFLQRPDLVARVGADGAAKDAPDALRLASGLAMMRAAAE